MALTFVEMLPGMTNNAIPIQGILYGQNGQFTMLSQNIIWMKSTLGMPIKL